MSLPTTVAEIIDRHVTFTLESIDRMYLNVYQPMLQRGGGVSVFFRQHRQEACAYRAGHVADDQNVCQCCGAICRQAPDSSCVL